MTTEIATNVAQQRWLECYNDSDWEIPPFSIVKLADVHTRRASIEFIITPVTVPSERHVTTKTRPTAAGCAVFTEKSYAKRIRGWYGFTFERTIRAHESGLFTMETPCLASMQSGTGVGYPGYNNEFDFPYMYVKQDDGPGEVCLGDPYRELSPTYKNTIVSLYDFNISMDEGESTIRLIQITDTIPTNPRPPTAP